MAEVYIACTRNGVFGYKGDGPLPWSVTELNKYDLNEEKINKINKIRKKDMTLFKNYTLGKSIIMGRKTYDAMGRRLLPGRSNVIISNSLVDVPGALVDDDPELIINLYINPVVIGGLSLIKSLLESNSITIINLNILDFDIDWIDEKELIFLDYQNLFPKEKLKITFIN